MTDKAGGPGAKPESMKTEPELITAAKNNKQSYEPTFYQDGIDDALFNLQHTPNSNPQARKDRDKNQGCDISKTVPEKYTAKTHTCNHLAPKML